MLRGTDVQCPPCGHPLYPALKPRELGEGKITQEARQAAKVSIPPVVPHHFNTKGKPHSLGHNILQDLHHSTSFTSLSLYIHQFGMWAAAPRNYGSWILSVSSHLLVPSGSHSLCLEGISSLHLSSFPSSYSLFQQMFLAT